MILQVGGGFFWEGLLLELFLISLSPWDPKENDRRMNLSSDRSIFFGGGWILKSQF